MKNLTILKMASLPLLMGMHQAQAMDVAMTQIGKVVFYVPKKTVKGFKKVKNKINDKRRGRRGRRITE